VACPGSDAIAQADRRHEAAIVIVAKELEGAFSRRFWYL